MTDAKTLERAKVAVDKILSALDVVRVVFVDDENRDEPALEEALVAIPELSPNELLEIVPEFGPSVPDDADVRKDEFRHFWADWSTSVRRVRSEGILTAARLKNGRESADVADAALLHELVPRDALMSLTPGGWIERRDQLLRENTGHRTLFLFDQDMSKGGGDTEGGIKIIASVLADDHTGHIICGLLTHTVPPEEQLNKWDQLSVNMAYREIDFLLWQSSY